MVFVCCDLRCSHIHHLAQLLDSTDVDLRIGAGEAIALIYEGARQFDEDFGFDVGDEDDAEVASHPSHIDELCDKLKQLATDAHKYRAKKDRKAQRSSFRDILRAIEVSYLLLQCITDFSLTIICNFAGERGSGH